MIHSYNSIIKQELENLHPRVSIANTYDMTIALKEELIYGDVHLEEKGSSPFLGRVMKRVFNDIFSD